MQRKKRNIFWYFFSPILVQWVISFIVEIGVEFVYIFQNLTQLESVMNSEEKLSLFMNEMLIILNQHATEVTILIAVCTLPILYRMYRKDRLEADDWWKEKQKFSGKSIFLVFLLSVCVCIAMNDFILLSGLSGKSEAYTETAQVIYSSPILVQLLGVGILVPVMEEMVYRGLLYRRLREYLPFSACMLGTAILFGVYHGNSVQFVYAAVLGMFLAYLFEKFRSVKVPILFHVSANLTSLLCSWTGVYVWIFSSLLNVTVVTVLACVGAAGIIIVLKYYENVK